VSTLQTAPDSSASAFSATKSATDLGTRVYPRCVSAFQAAASSDDLGRQVEACEELRAYLYDDLGPKAGALDTNEAHWGIVLALLASASTTYEAAVRLARDGFGHQAAMLNRSLFEAMVDSYWVAKQPELAIERMRDHTKYNARLTARTSAKYPAQFGDLPVPPPLSEEEDKRLRKLYRGGSLSWTGLSLYDRVTDISGRWPAGKAREHLFFFVDIANSINNYMLHSTPWGMTRAARPVTTSAGGKAVRFHVGASDAFCSEALFGSFWTASSLARLMLEECSLDVEAFEDGLYQRGIRAFVSLRPDELRKLGRNEQCPCGSGLKVKRCHGQ
jgi:hypothetical protein